MLWENQFGFKISQPSVPHSLTKNDHRMSGEAAGQVFSGLWKFKMSLILYLFLFCCQKCWQFESFSLLYFQNCYEWQSFTLSEGEGAGSSANRTSKASSICLPKKTMQTEEQQIEEPSSVCGPVFITPSCPRDRTC